MFELRTKGLIDREIAGRLQISRETVKTHSAHIIQRCHARNMVHAVAKILS